MIENKKTWTKPELIVLVRSKPEEAVLTACKVAGTPTTFATRFSGCRDDNMPWCEGNCNEVAAS